MHAVIKLGGAAITEKQRTEQQNVEALSVIARQAAELFDLGLQIIVVHGAGGFGHHQARSGGLAAGGTGGVQVCELGTLETHQLPMILPFHTHGPLADAGCSPLRC